MILTKAYVNDIYVSAPVRQIDASGRIFIIINKVLQDC